MRCRVRQKAKGSSLEGVRVMPQVPGGQTEGRTHLEYRHSLEILRVWFQIPQQNEYCSTVSHNFFVFPVYIKVTFILY